MFNPKMLNPMRAKDILHPDDEKALSVLQRLPFFDRFVRKCMEYGGEQYYHGENLGSMMEVTETTYPELHKLLEETANEIGIDIPQFYLYNDPMMNAYTYGDTNPFICIANSVIEKLDADEVKCILAHECGHILCRHTLYNTMVAILRDAADDLGLITETLYYPIRLALQYWSRKSELSADRCAAAICGEEIFQRSMLKMATGLSKITGSPYQMVKQAKQYLSMQKESTWFNIQQNCRIAWYSHPQMCIRAYEIDRWSNSPVYKRFQHIQ